MGIESKIANASFRIAGETALAATKYFMPLVSREIQRIRRTREDEKRLTEERERGLKEMNLTNLRSGDSEFPFTSQG